MVEEATVTNAGATPNPPPPPPPPNWGGPPPPTFGGAAPPPAVPAERAYPARLQIEYPEKLSRVTTAFRAVLIIPIAIVYSILSGGSTQWTETENGEWVASTSAGIAGSLFFATLLMILFRKRYPRWWYDFAARCCLRLFGLMRPRRSLWLDRFRPHLQFCLPSLNCIIQLSNTRKGE
jgi:hypothetical protein